MTKSDRFKFNVARLTMLAEFRSPQLMCVIANALMSYSLFVLPQETVKALPTGLHTTTWSIIFLVMSIVQWLLIWIPAIHSRYAIWFSGIQAGVWLYLTALLIQLDLPSVFYVGLIVIALMSSWAWVRAGDVSPCEAHMGDGIYCPPLNKAIEPKPINVDIRGKRNYI